MARARNVNRVGAVRWGSRSSLLILIAAMVATSTCTIGCHAVVSTTIHPPAKVEENSPSDPGRGPGSEPSDRPREIDSAPLSAVSRRWARRVIETGIEMEERNSALCASHVRAHRLMVETAMIPGRFEVSEKLEASLHLLVERFAEEHDGFFEVNVVSLNSSSEPSSTEVTAEKAELVRRYLVELGLDHRQVAVAAPDELDEYEPRCRRHRVRNYDWLRITVSPVAQL